jgi:RND superfamily putative drug exporter
MSVLVGLAVATTFVPAAMAIAGRSLFWPLRVSEPVPATGADVEDAPRARRSSRGRRAVGLAVAHPKLMVLACVMLLAGCASGLARIHPGNGLIRGLPSGSEPVRAYRAASQGFTPGLLSPTVIVVERRGIVARRAELAALQRRLAAFGDVAAVAGPASNPLPAELGAALSRTGDAARFVVVFRTDPLGARAIRRLGRLRDRLPGMLAASGLADATASIAGDTALAEETVDRTLGDGLRVLPLLLAALYVVLAVFLRALVAPLLMLLASTLVVAAALGLAAYVVQDLRYGEITYYVPFAAAVLLVALGSDYTMFLAGRVWEAARTRPVREAIVEGSSRAATAIAVAGGLLAASFALLVLVPLRPFRELAFVMSAGLVLDAFLVRPLLLPALLSLAGEHSAWPSRRLTLDRLPARARARRQPAASAARP